MEVTKHNFKTILPKVVDAIEGCDFVAIDGEFTGLRTVHNNLNELDTVEERYAKIRHSAQNFGMIQFGLSTFRFVPTKKKYSHATYCFYILAKPGAGELFDTGSLNFLANNGFDFNKLFKEGISYISMKEEAELRLKLQETPVEISKPTPVKVNEIAAKSFLKESEKKVADFMNDATQEELVIDGKTLTGFHRKIIYNNVAAKYENIQIQSVISDSGVRNLVVKKFHSQTALKEHIEKERQKNLDEKIGFTHVIRKLLESNKPIVGHNLVLDLVHLFEKTVMPLPEKYETFKKMVLANFPTIYDTKLLAKDPPFSEDIPITGLEILFSDLCEKYKPPEFEIEADHESFEIGDSSKAHDAGYDAFMTGVCFATMVKKLGKTLMNMHAYMFSRLLWEHFFLAVINLCFYFSMTI
ncbi:poly(A)-specific ribonuclease PARN-like [Palaemon carinicauda]|uniref:poly(A)-specific ribonuclease PARN-like n=1 Tax=Palaemon carinicauda TaxID=392227 RepID=UPI0035B59089